MFHTIIGKVFLFSIFWGGLKIDFDLLTIRIINYRRREFRCLLQITLVFSPTSELTINVPIVTTTLGVGEDSMLLDFHTTKGGAENFSIKWGRGWASPQ